MAIEARGPGAPAGHVGVTRQIARWAVATDAASLPAEVMHRTARAVLDSLGVSIAAVGHDAVKALVATLRATGSGGRSTVVGSSWRASEIDAALVNGVMAHVLDWDDTILPTRLHPSATLLPPLLAVGENTGATGRDLLAAFAIGFDVQQRLALAAYPAYADRGWHGTGIVGGIGAAIAVGRLLALDVDRMQHAIGIAATGGAGLTATFGSMSKALNLGRAAAVGLQSARLAERGFTSNPRLLDPDLGFLAMYDDAPRAAAVADGLGEHWAITDDGFKPYPCGVVAHAAIDAARELCLPGELPLTLRVEVPPEAMVLMGNPDPATGLEAKFSVRYVCAVALVDGDVAPAAFTDTALAGYREAIERVQVTGGPEIGQDEAHAVATFADGSKRHVNIKHARGTLANPLTDADLRAKFRAACQAGKNPHADAILAVVDDLAALPITAITELLADA